MLRGCQGVLRSIRGCEGVFCVSDGSGRAEKWTSVNPCLHQLARARRQGRRVGSPVPGGVDLLSGSSTEMSPGNASATQCSTMESGEGEAARVPGSSHERRSIRWQTKNGQVVNMVFLSFGKARMQLTQMWSSRRLTRSGLRPSARGSHTFTSELNLRTFGTHRSRSSST